MTLQGIKYFLIKWEYPFYLYELNKKERLFGALFYNSS